MQRPERPSSSEQARRQNLSINITAYRHAYGLSIKQAARFARLPTGTWRKLESGESGASQQTLERVAEALNTTPEILTRPPVRRTMRTTAFSIAGCTLDAIPEDLVALYLEQHRHLANLAGHTVETLVETAEALDADPLDVLAELLRPRPPPPKTVH